MTGAGIFAAKARRCSCTETGEASRRRISPAGPRLASGLSQPCSLFSIGDASHSRKRVLWAYGEAEVSPVRARTKPLASRFEEWRTGRNTPQALPLLWLKRFGRSLMKVIAFAVATTLILGSGAWAGEGVGAPGTSRSGTSNSTGARDAGSGESPGPKSTVSPASGTSASGTANRTGPNDAGSGESPGAKKSQ